MKGLDAACKEDFAARKKPNKKIEDSSVLSVDKRPNGCLLTPALMGNPFEVRPARPTTTNCLSNAPLVDHVVFARSSASVMSNQNMYGHVNRPPGKPAALNSITRTTPPASGAAQAD